MKAGQLIEKLREEGAHVGTATFTMQGEHALTHVATDYSSGVHYATRMAVANIGWRRIQRRDFSMTKTDTAILAAIEGARTDLHDRVDRAFDALKAKFMSDGTAINRGYKIPTLAQCQDPANKSGANLTERGAEILYRLFDDGAGYNRASKALGITQTAARNRKGLWEKLGGLNRQRTPLPGID